MSEHVDIEMLRKGLATYRKSQYTPMEEWFDDGVIETLLNEIVALREQVEMQRLELCRYDDAWCQTDEERQLRPRA